ncbi:hypothetical protein [Candidatus Odyssella acanthamoebae]|uniref:Uncharacterized protein n=1 Tax=Candidatus Odyssella acanthamoebae TaxID=91604 RepID=A0A077AVA9_9PROT|nr:hypothetical protein [Candidatus Paracaedibacter acanthamoebae]AIK95578.1 hypothetical protein ID47_00600 [Candidatus Paracaedibacter acanthamoebae]
MSEGFGFAHSNLQYGQSPVIGAGMNVPIHAPTIQHTSHVATPEWMVMIDDLLSSTIEGSPDGTDADLTQCAELLGWYSEQARLTKGNTANQLFSTSAVQHSSVVIAIPMGDYVASLENKMNTGSNIAAIKLIRLANITDLKVPLQFITYTNCRIESTQQQLDKLILSFRPETRQNTVVKYGQDGQKVGNNVSFFDYTKGTAEA